MGSAADPDDGGAGVCGTNLCGDVFFGLGQAVEKDGKVLPAELPKGVTLRKAARCVGLHADRGAAGGGVCSGGGAAGCADGGVAGGRGASGKCSSRRIRKRICGWRCWPIVRGRMRSGCCPRRGSAEDLGATPSVSTGDKDGAELAACAGGYADDDGAGAELAETGGGSGLGDAGCGGRVADADAGGSDVAALAVCSGAGAWCRTTRCMCWRRTTATGRWT